MFFKINILFFDLERQHIYLYLSVQYKEYIKLEISSKLHIN